MTTPPMMEGECHGTLLLHHGEGENKKKLPTRPKFFL